MRLSTYLITLAVLACGSKAAQPPIRNVYTFGRNRFIENIAVRPCSKLLVTSMSVPDLFSIDPTVTTPTASVAHTFENGTGLMGITEVAPDVFALTTGIWDLANTRAALGSLKIWTVNFNKSPYPLVKFITTVANSTVLNGIVRHPLNPKILLAADSAAGAVWRIDLTTGAHSIAFSSPLLQPTGTAAEGKHLGINGLTAAGSTLYFTNSAQGIFGKVTIDLTGNQVGAISIISNSLAAGADVVYDDIALDPAHGKAWIASHPDYAVGVNLVGGAQTVIGNATKLLNPTSAAFGRGSGREQRTLYVTNGGEFTPEFDLINEGVAAISLY